MNRIIPIFFAADDRYAPYLGVALRSLIDNASKKYCYRIYILTDALNDENRRILLGLQNFNTRIEFVNVKSKLNELGQKLHLRDYYTAATYYRFFIPEMFEQYKKGIYLDCDITVLGDISKLYNVKLTDKLIAAVSDEVITENKVFSDYSQTVLGIDKNEYFNAGILVMNLEKLRQVNIRKAFENMLSVYTFKVAQDQDYLNVLCNKSTLYLDTSWNKTPLPESDTSVIPNIIHFKINWKPWHYKNVVFGEYFWKYADKTPYKDLLHNMLDSYTKLQKENDSLQFESLKNMAAAEVLYAKKTTDCPLKLSIVNNVEKAPHRLEALKKINELEKQGIFDKDVENDPPTRPIKQGEVDYLNKKLLSKLKTSFANFVAKKYFDNKIDKGELIIKEIRGLENYIEIMDSGAIITCNHFNPYDNYAVFKVIEGFLGKKRLYKIIREGNYTSFKGIFGFFFRNCNTLPLCSNLSVWREFESAVDTLLSRGEKILIYPEQAMWWNYKKPRPLKQGAFRFAAKNRKPVLPFFITMEDSEKLDADGFFIQQYTVHILKPIYPKSDKSIKENSRDMCEINSTLWKEAYESFYGKKLEYNTDEKSEKVCFM